MSNPGVALRGGQWAINAWTRRRGVKVNTGGRLLRKTIGPTTTATDFSPASEWFWPYQTIATRVSVTSASAVSAFKGAAKRVYVTSASVVSVLKGASKQAAVTSASAVSALKGAAKRVSVTSASAVSALKGVATQVSVTSVTSASALKGAATRVSVTSVTSASAVSVLKGVAKGVSVTSASAVSVLKGVAKRVSTLTAGLAGVVLISATIGTVYNQTVTAATSSTVAVSKAIAKFFGLFGYSAASVAPKKRPQSGGVVVVTWTPTAAVEASIAPQADVTAQWE